MATTATPQYYWVSWPRNAKDEKTARQEALIWGPQPDAPPQLDTMFLAGPFRDKKAAQAYEDAIGQNTIIPPPGTPIVGNVPSPSLPNIINDIPGFQQVGAFFSALSEASTWIRVAEVVAGLILIAVGVARVTHAVPVATKIAKTIGTKGLA